VKDVNSPLQAQLVWQVVLLLAAEPLTLAPARTPGGAVVSLMEVSSRRAQHPGRPTCCSSMRRCLLSLQQVWCSGSPMPEQQLCCVAALELAAAPHWQPGLRPAALWRVNHLLHPYCRRSHCAIMTPRSYVS